MKRRTVRLIIEFLRPNSVDRLAIPVLDGPLSPNDALDEFGVAVSSLVEPDDIAGLPNGDLIVSAGRKLYRVSGPDVEPLASLPGEVISLAVGPEGAIYVGIADLGVARIEANGSHEMILESVAGQPLGVPTAMTTTRDGRLYVTDGSSVHRWDQRPADLMSKSTAGRLVEVDLDTGNSSEILSGLAWPNGVCATEDDGLLLSESWAHRISKVDPATRRSTNVRSNMAAYPSRICPASNGRYWVAFWALRNAVVEFVLTEDEFREEMMATIPQEYWVGPAMRATTDPWEPMQIGGLKHFNRVKPWAPARSYGLCARMDTRGVVDLSFHARGGSDRHGTTSAIEIADTLYVVSRGGSLVLSRQVGR